MTRPILSRLLATVLVPVVSAICASTTFASSDFDAGVLQRRDPAIGTDLSLGLCRLFIGPRGAIAAGEFVLRIGDENFTNGYELELHGQATPDGSGGYTLSSDTSD